MILHSLSISGLRCFRNPIELNDFSEGINIIYGPNETGKSTLITALVLAFLNRHDMTGDAIEALRPWGTSLSPLIVAEFTSGGKRYRLEKGFLENARSILSEWDGRRYQRLDEGKAADERVRQMMQARFSGRGLSKNTQWGLAHLLWMPQGADRFSSPSLAEPGIQDYFRQAMGATIFTRKDDELLGLISKKYADIFTPKEGDFKANSEVSLAQHQLEITQQDLDKASRDLEAIREAESDLLSLNRRLAELDTEVTRLKQQRQDLACQIELIKSLRSQLDTKKAQSQAATQAWQTVWSEWQQVQGLKRTIATTESEIAQKESIVVRLKTNLDKATADLNSKHAIRKDLEQNIKEINGEFQKANDIQQAKNRLELVSSLSKQVKSAQDLSQRISELESELLKQPSPGPSDVKMAEDAKSVIDAAEAEARARGLSIDVVAYRHFDMIVSTSEGQKTYAIRPDGSLTLVSTDRITLDIRDLGRFEIKSGSTDVKKLLERIAMEQKKLGALLDKYMVATVSELRKRYNWGLQQNAEIKTLKETLDRTLGPGNTIQTLEARLRQEEATLQEQCSRIGVTREQLTSVQTPDLHRLKNTLDSLHKEEEQLEKEIAGLEEHQKSLLKQVTDLEQEIGKLRATVEASSGELKRRLEPYDGDEQKLNSVMAEKEKEKVKMEQDLAQLKQLIPENAVELERDALKLDQQIKEIDEVTIPEIRERRAILRGKLEEAGNLGLYSKIAQCEEALQIARSRHQLALRKAQGIRLLHYIAHTRKNQLLNALTEPVKGEVSNLFRTVTGCYDRSIELLPDLSLSGVRIDPENPRAIGAVEDFSIGAQEQLMMCVRLALGRFLGQVERQLVVLDDPLVNTDPDRLGRILDLLEAASKTLQIVILTCHIDRYQGIACKRFDIREATLQ